MRPFEFPTLPLAGSRKERSNFRSGRPHKSVTRLASHVFGCFLKFFPAAFLYKLPLISSTPTLSFHTSSSQMANQTTSEFHDFLPRMAQKLGGEALIGELCNGFQLLMDKSRGMITFESLKRNSALLGLGDLADDELLSMLREGDTDGDGALSQMEFCVLMFRLSPDLMEESERCLEEALEEELNAF